MTEQVMAQTGAGNCTVTICEAVCKGCALCAAVCPKKLIEIDRGRLNPKGYHPAVFQNIGGCIGCAMCAMMCPDSAITVERA